nr:iron ABC transporter permease [uncultured Ottowia sp.]
MSTEARNEAGHETGHEADHAQARSAYGRRLGRRAALLALAALLLAALLLLDLATGPSGMALTDIFQALQTGPGGLEAVRERLPGVTPEMRKLHSNANILWHVRMPPALMGALVGMCLGLGGLQMQTILDNPLASPFTLGFSAAAGFGAALAIMFGGLLPVPGYVLTPAAAFGMTLAACALIYLLALARGANPEVLILGGIAVLFFFQSVQSLLQYIASPEILQQIVFWLFGDLQKASWTSVSVCAIVLLACLPFVARDAWALTALRLGDANAMSIGVPVQAIRRRAFVLVALLTAVAVCFVGTIGFVGLIAPHMARALVGEDHRFALPLAALTGALILSGASVFAKLISPGAVVPVGIITAVAGVPMLLGIIVSRKGGI